MNAFLKIIFIVTIFKVVAGLPCDPNWPCHLCLKSYNDCKFYATRDNRHICAKIISLKTMPKIVFQNCEKFSASSNYEAEGTHMNGTTATVMKGKPDLRYWEKPPSTTKVPFVPPSRRYSSPVASGLLLNGASTFSTTIKYPQMFTTSKTSFSLNGTTYMTPRPITRVTKFQIPINPNSYLAPASPSLFRPVSQKNVTVHPLYNAPPAQGITTGLPVNITPPLTTTTVLPFITTPPLTTTSMLPFTTTLPVLTTTTTELPFTTTLPVLTKTTTPPLITITMLPVTNTPPMTTTVIPVTTTPPVFTAINTERPLDTTHAVITKTTVIPLHTKIPVLKPIITPLNSTHPFIQASLPQKTTVLPPQHSGNFLRISKNSCRTILIANRTASVLERKGDLAVLLLQICRAMTQRKLKVAESAYKQGLTEMSFESQVESTPFTNFIAKNEATVANGTEPVFLARIFFATLLMRLV